MKRVTVYSISICFFVLVANTALADTISRSFELRYVSDDAKANGQTGFKGESSIFDNDQRLEYLKNYGEYAKKFFNDPRLDKKVVSLDQARERLQMIKPQPLPAVRKRLSGKWKAYGYKDGKQAASQKRIDYYNSLDGVSAQDGICNIDSGKKIVFDFKKQDWRMNLRWQVLVTPDSVFSFNISNAATISSQDIKSLSGWVDIKVELDLVNQRYNVYVNDKLVKDFVPFEKNTQEVSTLEIKADSSLQIDNIWGLGFAKDFIDGFVKKGMHSLDTPFLVETFIDDDFEIVVDVDGWVNSDYDDSRWSIVDLPYAHGSERYEDEVLYLRKKFVIPASQRVELNVECLDPSGELWVNGKPVYVADNRHPISVDITRYVDFDQENLIAVKVDPYYAVDTMRHTSSDRNIGWFAGRIHIDCTSDLHIKDVFAFTESIGDCAEIKVQVYINNKHLLGKGSAKGKGKSFQILKGQLQLKLYKWFPQESTEPVAHVQKDIKFRKGRHEKIEVVLKVDDPQLWSTDNCNLYKLVAQISDAEGNLIDDYVITTGIRTVSQEGGTFRINGKPDMMNGALLFSMPAPLGVLAKWQRSAPGEYIVKDLMQLKAMNANTARMSQHHGPVISINDPRYAEYGDQIGIMFQWATTSWVRTSSPWQLDFEGLPKYIRQVRNHPSIVMWQPGNHPNFKGFEKGMEWFEEVYNTIWPEDKSRLVCPTSNLGRLKNVRTDDGTRNENGKVTATFWVWTAPGLTRGSMDYMLGYGNDWTRIEKWPNARKSESEQNWSMGDVRVDYLNSKERAFFDFESEETIGQPNWNLRKGKPGYQVMSYEWYYDKDSIGVYLTANQWLESQAWQAFSGFEAYKKKRWFDYDGLAWCPLRGGGNTASYKKPLIDYHDHAKLGFYAIKMVFQPVLACSKNVDLVYGPSDKVPLVVMNIGDEKKVDVKVDVKTLSGKVAFSKTFKNVKLQQGRTFKDIQLDIKKKLKPGYYAFEYNVIEK